MLMDQDDPQQRIAEFEAQNDSHKPGRAWNFTNLWNGLVMALLVVTLGICAVTYGALTPSDTGSARRRRRPSITVNSTATRGGTAAPN